MKKSKANTVLSAFIFGTSLLLLCSFGTDSAYIILSRYKLQKIANAAALEYAATRGKDAYYSYGSETNCNAKVRTKLEHIYNTLGAGVLAFRIVSMKEKTNPTKKETVVKVQAQSKIMPAFLRFVGAKEIILHANAYAKTNFVEIETEIPTVPAGGAYDPTATYAIFNPPFVDSITPPDPFRKTAEVVTAKADFNGDFAIDFGYKTPGDTDFVTGGGFFVFAGYDTDTGVQWADIGHKVKRSDPPDPTAFEIVCKDPSLPPNTENCHFCVNANNNATSKVVTFELSQPDEALPFEPGGNITKFNYLKIYKAGAVAGTSVDGIPVNNIKRPCSTAFIPPMPVYAASIPVDDDDDDGSSAPAPVGFGGGPAFYSAPPAGGMIGDDDDSSSVSLMSLTPEPNIFNTPAKVKLIIMNNISLINAVEYNSFTDFGTELTCSPH